MKVDDIIAVPIGQSFDIQGAKITHELVQQFAQTCGFASVPHVRGDTSVFSLALGVEGGACLHGVATLCLLNSALEKVFALEDEYDVISYSYQNVIFQSPNIQGGLMSFKFTVLTIEKARLPILRLKKTVPVIKVTFGCEAFNSRFGKRVAKLEWALGYLKMSDVRS